VQRHPALRALPFSCTEDAETLTAVVRAVLLDLRCDWIYGAQELTRWLGAAADADPGGELGGLADVADSLDFNRSYTDAAVDME
jgi:hypothetical protein